MKTKISLSKTEHLLRSLVLGALLPLALVSFATSAPCQAAYTSPYTFATLAGKTAPDNDDKSAWSFHPKALQ
jgi:hypothetical protein